MKTKMLFALALLSGLAHAHADALTIGNPIVAGSGCIERSTHVELSGDRRFLVVLTDAFKARSGLKSKKSVDLKSCNLAIPITAPAGQQLALISEVNGYTSVKRGAVARYTQELFYAGGRAAPQTETFTGPVRGEFTVGSHETSPSNIAWTACGASANLRANLRLMTQGEASANIEQLNFLILSRPCR